MKEDQNNQLLSLFTQEFCYQSECVQLSLINFRIYNKKPTIINLLDLQEKYSVIKNFRLVETQPNQSDNVILFFESVEDILDFIQDKTTNFTYSRAFIINQQDGMSVEKNDNYYQPNQLQRQIQQEGFFIIGGRIQMKKLTSVQELIDRKNQQTFEQGSTFVNTERKISINQQIILNNQQNEENEQEAKPKKSDYIKPITQSIVYAGVLYGGLKLLKYLMKL